MLGFSFGNIKNQVSQHSNDYMRAQSSKKRELKISVNPCKHRVSQHNNDYMRFQSSEKRDWKI